MLSPLRLRSPALAMARQNIPAARSFATSRVARKESALHTEGRAEEIEKHKQEQLRAQKEGKGQWKDGLASDSESAVKADREAEKPIKEMQDDTARQAQKEKK